MANKQLNLGTSSSKIDVNVSGSLNIDGAEIFSTVDTKITNATKDKADSSHNHAASNITSGTLSSNRLPTISIAKGGTGATTAAAALTNLGLTATATELNYCNGVTSAIQTQFDNKAEKTHTHTKSQITNFPASLKNPYSLTIQGNGVTLTNGTYNGSAAKTINITPGSIGGAPFFTVTSASDMTAVFATLALHQTATIWIEGAYFKTLTNSLDAGNQAHGYATKLTDSILELRVGGGGYRWTIRVNASAKVQSCYRLQDYIEGIDIQPASIELKPAVGTGIGGFIDFHADGSTADYTSRIIEEGSGELKIKKALLTVLDPPTVSNARARNITCTRTDITAGSSSLVSGRICFVYS